MIAIIDEQEALDLIDSKVPEFHAVHENSNGANIYKVMDLFTSYTKESIKRNDFTQLKKCFGVTYELFREGNKCVRNAVSNVFLYSLQHFINKENVVRHQILMLIPPAMQVEMQNQVYYTAP